MQLNSHDSRIPVVLGSYVNAYGLVRAFAEKGMSSVVVAWKDDPSCHSRYCRVHVSPNPLEDEEGFVQSLLELAEDLPAGGFMICTDDATVSITARYRSLLDKHYIILGSSWEVLAKCIDKRPMYDAASQAGVLIPFTKFCRNANSVEELLDELPYPCMIKPAVTVGFVELLKLPGRTVVVENAEQLSKLLERIRDTGLENREYIVQEVVPGGPECLYTITAYCNMRSEIVAYSTGHKIRQHPPDAGTIISGRLVHVPDLVEPAQRLVSQLGFQGICNIEFKKDSLTGLFKLIEINARPGMWNYSATASGINLPWIAYQDLVKQIPPKAQHSTKELVWIMGFDDLVFPLIGWKRMGYGSYAMSFSDWLKSVQGRKVDPVLNMKDLGPWIYLFRHKILEPVRNKLASKLGMGKRSDSGDSL